MLNFACISPHPPVILPTVGSQKRRQQCQSTVKAMKKLGRRFREVKPDKLIMVSPHLPHERDNFTLYYNSEIKGNLRKFGDLKSKFSYPGEKDLRNKISAKAQKLPVKKRKLNKVDYGSLVPAYYLTGTGKKKINLLPIAFCDVSYKKHFQFGKIIGEIIQKQKNDIAVCASGDLSHRLKREAPAGFDPRGEKFDKKLVKLIKQKRVKEILRLDPELIEKAGECGFRSIIILLGILKVHDNWQPEVLSYQGPFGVGYLVSNIKLK